jgi:putative transposase
MPNYRRWYVPGGTYFFTVVTYNRKPLFQREGARTLLGECFRAIQEELPFETIAIVLLHDHLHALWQLPPGDADYSTRWKRIKAKFTKEWLAAGGTEAKITSSQTKRGNRGIWQPRFHEHVIDDENDLEAHFHYIHYNPVKHGYVFQPWDWEASTFRKYANLGYYPKNWGTAEPEMIKDMDVE